MKNAREESKKKRICFLIFKSFCFIFLIFLLGGLILFIYFAKDLPRPEKFIERELLQPTKIYDRTGTTLLYELYGEYKRIPIILDRIPKHLIQAVLVTEDANFYHHSGVDFRGIVRAVIVNLREGRIIEGGSTISQQLIRNVFLTRERTIGRKIRETILTLEIERRYSKNQILEWYLNQIPFGSNTYGVEAASQTFFNKSVSEITIPEAAILAALIRGPSFLSPYGPNQQKLLKRKNRILSRMAEQGYLKEEKLKELKQEQIEFAKILHPIQAPHFIMEIKDKLFSIYGRDYLKTAGLKVYTSLDWELQRLAEQAIKKRIDFNKANKAHNAGLVAINPKTGQILAMVGSKNWFGDPYPEGCLPGKNCLFEPYPNVTMLARQPGSAFKPLIYAAAFEKGYNDKEVVIDEETNFGIWGGRPYIPRNFDGRFRGPVTLRQALAQSLNIPSIKVFINLVGIEQGVKIAQRMGITTILPPVPSIVLGGGEVKLLDMVFSYGVFATEGLKNHPIFILKIEDSQGNIIEENRKNSKRVLKAQSAKLINNVLSDNEARAPMFGLRSRLYFEDHNVSVKTGSTDDFRDAWTIGYTPSIVVGVWAGNNDNSPTARLEGVTLAAPIWRNFMEEFLKLSAYNND